MSAGGYQHYGLNALGSAFVVALCAFLCSINVYLENFLFGFSCGFGILCGKTPKKLNKYVKPEKPGPDLWKV